MSNERKAQRDKQTDSTTKETTEQQAATSQPIRQATDGKRRRFRMSKKFRSKLLSSGIPDVLPVTCGDAEGELHVKKIGSGSRGPCVCRDGVWLTPNQFENEGGQCFAKCWKRSIQHGRTPLNTYVKLGLIKLHRQHCNCDVCSAPIVDTGRNSITKLKKTRKKRKKKNSKFTNRKDDERDDSDDIDQVSQDTRRRETENGDLDKDCSQTESESLRDKKGDRKRETLCAKNDVTLNVDNGTLIDGMSTEGRSRKRLWQEDAKCTDNSLDFSHVNSTENPEKVRRDVREDECDMEEQTSDVRRDRSPSSPGGYRIELSRDLQLVADATAALKRDGREMARATPDDFTPRNDRCLRSFSKVTGRSPTRSDVSTPRVYQGAFNCTTTDDSIGIIVDCNGQSSSCRSVALQQRVDCIKEKAGLGSCDVELWSVDQVADFLNAAGFRFQSDLFRQQLINGEALLNLQDRHLVENLKMKLGTSLRLMALIQCLESMQS